MRSMSIPAPAEPELIRLCRTRQWNSALSRLALNSSDVFISYHGVSVLAVASQYSAPLNVMQALLEAIHESPVNENENPLRLNGGGRGTALHEAIGNEEVDLKVIRMMIRADRNEQDNVGEVGQSPTSLPQAVRQQDVDGQIPLHLMIRRVFDSCPRPNVQLSGNAISCGSTPETKEGDIIYDAAGSDSGEVRDKDDELLTTLKELIHAYPEGCSVPDKREYEETPLVLAIKASLYASYAAVPSGMERGDGDRYADNVHGHRSSTPGNLAVSSHQWDFMLENRIYHVIKMIVAAHPEAARFVASGGYTAIHSAIFHGRCPKAIRLLLETANSRETLRKLCLSANATQMEVPLHLATMRMDELSVIQMLCAACPEAVHCRDARGRTPLLWPWIRLVGGSVNEDVDDEPMSFLLMRHIPSDYVKKEFDRRKFALSTLTELLSRLQDSARKGGRGTNSSLFITGFEPWIKLFVVLSEGGQETAFIQTKNESRVVIFWTKMQVLLSACLEDREDSAQQSTIVHAACLHPTCPLSVLQLAIDLHPTFLNRKDGEGRLPLHCASHRGIEGWRPYATPRRRAGESESALRYADSEAEEVVLVESALSSVATAFPEAVHCRQNDGRLPLHTVIHTLQNSIASHDYHQEDGEDPLKYVIPLVKIFPESIERRDGVTKLFPFMLAAAAAGKITEPLNDSSLDSARSTTSDMMVGETRCAAGISLTHVRQLAVIYGLLRLCPALVGAGFENSILVDNADEPDSLKRRRLKNNFV